MNNISYDGHHFTVTLENGRTFTFDHEDANMEDIQSALDAWYAWGLFVKSGRYHRETEIQMEEVDGVWTEKETV